MDAIEGRLWALTVVLCVVVVAQATLLAMAIAGWNMTRNKTRFLDLWRRNKLDLFIERSRTALHKEPNNTDALLFGAKALRMKGDLSNARLWFERALELEPSLKRIIQGELEIIRKKEAVSA